MPDPVISVENLGKQYRIRHQQSGSHTALRDVLADKTMSIVRRLGSVVRDRLPRGPSSDRPQDHSIADHGVEDFWALRDVSFEVKPGDVLGIIGRNGAGKSTLLKVLSRITEPTAGRVRIRGRVASLLEVGTGFHPELTGRENVYLNGAIMGMTRAEIRRKFDEIVAFADVEKFLDTPVKRYSSGMYVRLAFAVAAHLDPEILVVDEVLAVGDAEFQKKCLGKMKSVAAGEGRTVLFVSHNLGAVGALCDRAILIERGRLVMNASPQDVISYYLSDPASMADAANGEVRWPESERPHSEEFALTRIRLLAAAETVRDTFAASESFNIEITFQVKRRLRGARFNLSLSTLEGEIAFMATDHIYQPKTLEEGFYRSTCMVPGGLLNRRSYRIGLHFGIPGQGMILDQADYLEFTVAGVGNQATHFPDRSWPGVVCPKMEWRVERLDPGHVNSTGASLATPSEKNCCRTKPT